MAETQTTSTTTTNQPAALLGSLPLWLQAVSVVGFPIVVALFSMARDVGYLPSTGLANQSALAELSRQHLEANFQGLELIRLSREICLNGAKGLDSVKACSIVPPSPLALRQPLEGLSLLGDMARGRN